LGLGLSFLGLGFRGRGVGFRVQRWGVERCRVHGSRVRVQGSGLGRRSKRVALWASAIPCTGGGQPQECAYCKVKR